MSYSNWAIKSFDTGIIDKLDSNLIPESAASACENFVAPVAGRLRKRKGQENINETALDGPIRGLHPYYFGEMLTERQLIIAAGTKVYKHDVVDTFTPIKEELTDSVQPVMFETCVNYMVAFSGVDEPWKWNGTVESPLNNAPADGRYPVLHKEKIFVTLVTDPSCLVWSDSFQPEEWPEVNYWYIKQGDGDEITNITKFIGELIIFKRRSIHSLKGTDMENFRLDEMEERIGCVGPRASTRLGLQILFVSDEGICTFNGMSAINLSRERIPKLWSQVNLEHVHKAVAGNWNNLAWFAVPIAPSTENNVVIVYNPFGEGSFWLYSNMEASCFEKYHDGASIHFYSGNPGSGFVAEQDVGDDDFGEPIEAFWVGKTFDAGGAEHMKRARRIFVERSPDTVSVPDIQISLDGGTFNSLRHNRQDGHIEEYKVTTKGKWRYLTPRLAHEDEGPCEVRGIMAPIRVKRKANVRGVVST